MNYEHTASACTNSSDDDPALLDSTSFAQLTPPPLHRKPVTVARAETLKVINLRLLQLKSFKMGIIYSH